METNNHELHVIVGTGPLGMAVMRELRSRGKRVRVVNRRGQADVPEGVETAQADVTDLATAREACQGATVIYNCTNAPYTEWPEKFPPIMDGIIKVAAATGAKLVSADNLYMYGRVSERLTEDLAYAATGRKGHTRAQMATTLIKAHKNGKVRATIGRASDFFGPGVIDSAVGELVFRPVLEGKTVNVLGNLDAPHTYTFVGDFAAGLVTLGGREEALGEIWHIPSAETLTTRQFLKVVFEETGTTPNIRAVPRLFVMLLALFNPMMRQVKEILYEFEEPFVVDHGKCERVFGCNTTPHREAIRQTLDWFRRRIESGS